MKKFLPIMGWIREYNRDLAGRDLLAAVIVTLMLIPQSLAYAMLAGLPPVTGLYASILPLVAYTLLGTSKALAVGPVAVVSLMTAAAAETLFPAGSPEYSSAVLMLALLSGGLLLLMSLLRLGFLANFLSHPVISGFISASGILIALSQLKHILGVSIHGESVPELVQQLWLAVPDTNIPTLLIGMVSVFFLFWVRLHGRSWLLRRGLSQALAGHVAKAGPVFALLATIALVTVLHLDEAGVKVVGEVPRGLPSLALPEFSLTLAEQLLPAALLISLVGFVESISVAQTFAAKKRQRVEPDQELFALGGANIAAAVSGGLPVTGGFSRSVVNYDAGAETPMAGGFTAIGIAVTVLFLTPLFQNLPKAVLAATIIVAVLSLVDLKAVLKTWRHSRHDASAMLATIAGVLFIGVEAGIILGIALSLLLFLWRTSKPHVAVVGLLPGTQHFRNVQRFPEVLQSSHVLSVRVDESLYFPNARFLEDKILELLDCHPQATQLVLMCSAVNMIDASALESIEAINERLGTAGVQMHLSEVKGPVMDQLKRSDFFSHFHGQVFLSQYQALQTLDPEMFGETAY